MITSLFYAMVPRAPPFLRLCTDTVINGDTSTHRFAQIVQKSTKKTSCQKSLQGDFDKENSRISKPHSASWLAENKLGPNGNYKSMCFPHKYISAIVRFRNTEIPCSGILRHSGVIHLHAFSTHLLLKDFINFWLGYICTYLSASASGTAYQELQRNCKKI